MALMLCWVQWLLQVMAIIKRYALAQHAYGFWKNLTEQLIAIIWQLPHAALPCLHQLPCEHRALCSQGPMFTALGLLQR